MEQQYWSVSMVASWPSHPELTYYQHRVSTPFGESNYSMLNYSATDLLVAAVATINMACTYNPE